MIERITIQFPRRVLLPQYFYNEVLNSLNDFLKDKYPNMRIGGMGCEMSNPFIEPITFDETHFHIGVEER